MDKSMGVLIDEFEDAVLMFHAPCGMATTEDQKRDAEIYAAARSKLHEALLSAPEPLAKGLEASPPPPVESPGKAREWWISFDDALGHEVVGPSLYNQGQIHVREVVGNPTEGEWEKFWREQHAQATDICGELNTKITALEAEVTRLREGLEEIAVSDMTSKGFRMMAYELLNPEEFGGGEPKEQGEE